jgi:radical SAM protein with 4Fe4S-binding SPASM domain
MKKPEIIRYRYESFGGILHLGRPAALVFVDRDYMRGLGYPDSPLWETDRRFLSAPTEAHLTLTGRCEAGCPGCYMGSYPVGHGGAAEAAELSFEDHSRSIEVLAEARVFHVALGGGESLELPWIFDLADRARALGVVPNLTTNGYRIDAETARRCRVFGQINVSVDGVGEHYTRARGVDGFARADAALTHLRRAGCSFGINTVVSHANFDHLPDIVRYAKKKKAGQIEFLRFKPAGRGADRFSELDLTPEQALAFYPLISGLARRYRLNLRLDCSFMPHVFAHEPDRDRAERFGVAGCWGGDMLLGVRPDGMVNACSFAPVEPRSVLDLPTWWDNPEVFAPFRAWDQTPDEPCASCAYLDLCRGGCRAVSLALTGSLTAPDPGCPLVLAEASRL